MMKRWLALLCILALLAGMYTVPVSAQEESASAGGLLVGYAKGDINPWLTSTALYGEAGVPMPAGVTTTDEVYKNYTVRLPSTYTYNATSNNYSTTSKRMIKVPMAGYANSKERLSTGLQDDNGDGYIGYGDGLFFTCTTMTDPSNDYTLFFFTSDTVSGYSGLLESVAEKIVAKMAERGVTMNMNQVNLSGSHTHGGPDFTALRGSGNALWIAYYDYVVEKMASAAVGAYDSRKEAVMSRGAVDASEVTGYQLNTIRQFVSKQYKDGRETGLAFVSGTNLNTFAHADKAVNGFTYEQTKIADADDTMYILQFQIEGEKPIALVNWRAHTTTMSASANTGLTSDYVNSFRYAMEKEGYRVAFYQGASGNVNSSNTWTDDFNVTEAREKAITYGGQLLKQTALECLDKHMQVQSGSTIRATYAKMTTQSQEYSEGLIAAANDHEINGHSGYHPKPYLHTDGKYYYINSSHHASAVLRGTSTATLDLRTYVLGDGVAIVTSPCEMFDRYSLEVDTLAKACEDNREDNDWYKLESDSYGMPFVFGYTNAHSSYLGNYLSYNYNMDFEYTRNDGTIDGTYGVGVGSYETNTSRYVQGTGEAVVAQYYKMLSMRMAPCVHCDNATVEWTALTQLSADLSKLENGHYYLCEDIETADTIEVSGKVCLDLNGHTITSAKRTFYCKNIGTEFSLMDTSEDQSGKVTAYTNNETPGGVVYAYNATDNSPDNVIFNLYGGTLELKSADGNGNLVEKGGVVCLFGTMNMYGGTVRGGDIREVRQNKKNTYTSCGAAIFVYQYSVLNIYGGTVIAGTIPAEVADKNGNRYTPGGRCIFLATSSSVCKLSGNVSVDEIYLNSPGSDSLQLDNFTGSARIALNSSISVSVRGSDIGSVSGTVPLTLINVNDKQHFEKNGSDLYVYRHSGVARIGETYYSSISDAIRAFDSETGEYIQLVDSVTDTITVDGELYLDLNGYDVDSVTGSGVLYVMDSETDDFIVDAQNHTGYGKIGQIDSGVTVCSVPVGSVISRDSITYPYGVTDNYVMITEPELGTSFHRVILQITAMSLRAKDEGESAYNTSLYYKSNFCGDALVAENVVNFGIALSTTEDPDETNMGVTNQYTQFSGDMFKAGANNSDATSTLLRGIIKESNDRATNERNADIGVYGRAYLQMQDGQYVFGDCVLRSLKEQVEGVDELWDRYSDVQKTAVLGMYEKFSEFMKFWSVDHIAADA